MIVTTQQIGTPTPDRQNLVSILNEDQAAEYLGIDAGFLRDLRRTSAGPDCVPFGRQWYYALDDLESFATAFAKGFHRPCDIANGRSSTK